MKGNRFFKNIRFNIIIIFLTSLFFLNNAFSAGTILYVSDGATDPPNLDIYQMNADGTGATRLTDSPSIDNHPDLSPDGTMVVFSSDNVGGNFEIFKAPLATLSDEGTWVQLTSFGCNGTAPESELRCTPARHPHWSPDGTEIIYTANDGCCASTDIYVSHCSVPVQIVDPCGEHYERIHIMNNDGSNDRVIDPLHGIDDPVQDFPGLTSDCDNITIYHCGHPDFNPAGDKIVFSAARNKIADDWEVFVCDWDGTKATNLQQITQGSSYTATPNPNPVKMTGGARFINSGADIIFSSTRTYKGNSQLFKIPDWTSQSLPLPVNDDRRLTYHCGNDYVPEEIHGGSGEILCTSDAKDNWGNPTDLDIWTMNPDGSSRTNITNTPTTIEEQLIADEVSWFCGLPRNLSPCVFMPRAVSIESKWLMYYSSLALPYDFPRISLYPYYISWLSSYLYSIYPNYLSSINTLLSQLQELADDDVDGLINEDPLDGIDNDDDGSIDEDHPRTAETAIASKQIVIPSGMGDVGPGTWCDECVPCDECLMISSPPQGFIAADLQSVNVGDPYSQTFTVDGGNLPISWQIFAGQLPPGLSLNQNTGEISGTPTQSGTFEFSIAASDTNGNADSVDDNISVIGTDPAPDITANGSGGTVNINKGDQLSIAISLSSGGSPGASADWWIIVSTPSGGWEHFDLAQGGFIPGLSPTFPGFSLLDLGSTGIFNTSSLGAGTHTYYFAVDLGGGQLFLDSVVVIVTAIDPSPQITANGSGGTVNINEGDPLSIAVSLSSGSFSGASADWLIVVRTPSGWQYFDLAQGGFTPGLSPTFQGFSLVDFGSTVISNPSGLGAGTYTYYFAVDPGGGQLFFQSVVVNIISP